ncbi:hypothetical protein PHMEG_00023284 [Phytophthora megakarya]|uniref:Uncharacterized protein n=1 Tax=Phytophthora megakarya TaxID=4795 RepID=A0A225VHG2_9STRA|nr:hypothetical protein PHMEG_00023284 [Phytophthora megakarya]
MTSTAAQVLERLTAQWDEETANISSNHENFGDVARHVEDESSDPESPILAQFVASGGDDTLKGMSNFSSPKLDALWLSSMLKHFDIWHKHAIDFNMGLSTLEKMVHCVIQTIELVLYHALYATDVKFQAAYRLNGRFTAQKVYFAAKHKLYVSKIESKLTMVLDRLSIHRQMLKKEDDSVYELGGEPSQFLHMWAVLVAKVYQGAGRVLRTIQLRKQPRGSTLDRENIARNQAILADRVLVKNCFGSMFLLWNSTYAIYNWTGNRFDSVARLSTALTNQQVRSRPAPYNTRVPASQRETQFDPQKSFSFLIAFFRVFQACFKLSLE